jgi:hypothetical protein
LTLSPCVFFILRSSRFFQPKGAQRLRKNGDIIRNQKLDSKKRKKQENNKSALKKIEHNISILHEFLEKIPQKLNIFRKTIYLCTQK